MSHLVSQACSRCVGELAASVTVPGVVEMVTVAVPAERFVPRCSVRAATYGSKHKTATE